MIERKFAEQVMDCFLECSDELNQAIFDINDSGSRDTYLVARKRIRRVMGLLLLKIANPIGKEHPDLYPEELKS